MWKYRLFDLDPTRDIDDAIARYEAAGWHTWAAGRGAQVVINGVLVHRLSLRREDASRAVSGPSQHGPTAVGAVNGPLAETPHDT